MAISLYGAGNYQYGYNRIQNDLMYQNNAVDVNQNADVNSDGHNQEASLPEIKKAPRILTDSQLEDFSFDLGKNGDKSSIGKDSDLALLDREGNVSDMAKDRLLDQYKFFVGKNTNTQNLIYESEDGAVRRIVR